MEKAISTLSKYLALFADGLEEHWKLGDDKGGYLCTNNGLRALLVLFRKVLSFVEGKEDIKARALDPDQIVEHISPYVQHVIDYFKTAGESDITAFRGRIARAGVDYNALQMMSIIHHADSSFETRELAEWISKQDVEGTKEARGLIDEINDVIFSDIVTKLQEKHTTVRNAWWERGIPQAIRIATYERFTKENDGRELHQFLSLSNYPEILLYEDNWEMFKDFYSFPENRTKRKKTDQVAWIQRLNKIRNITHHVEKGPLSKDQVDYVRRVHRLVKKHVAGQEAIPHGSVFLPNVGETDREAAE